MNILEIHELLERMLQKNQLPSFISGLTLGIFLVLVIIRVAGGKRSVGLVKLLKDQLAQLTVAHNALNVENEGLRAQSDGIEREKSLLSEKVLGQGGRIEALAHQVAELSLTSERLSTERYDLEARLKVDRKARRDAQTLARRYSEQLDAINKTDGKIWLEPTNGQAVPFLPLSVRQTAIISLVNLKGGVGKTTITANLGAAFAAQGLRVLLIDLDHQSSLTHLCLSRKELVEVERSNRFIDDLFSGGGDLSALNRCITRLETPTGAGQMYLAPVREEFANVENQLMTRWHSRLTPEDIRYRLRGALHSPRLRQHYDVELIDCPPRLTTGSINALASCDYVLIPVLLEPTSAENVPRLLGWLKRFQTTSCMELNVLGVVGNKANPRAKLIARERLVWNGLGERCAEAWGGPVHLFEEVIRDHHSIIARFASLDPRYQGRYQNLVTQIRQDIPHAHLQPSELHSIASSAAGGGGH